MKSFSEIIPTIYRRAIQAGDSLSGAFATADPDAFDPAHDVGPVGPGDAMSEFTGYYDPKLNTWANLILHKEVYLTDIYPITADLFSNSQPSVRVFTDWVAGGSQYAEWPITVTADLGTRPSTIFSNVADSHIFPIVPEAFPDGTVSLAPTTGTAINFLGVTALSESTTANITLDSFKYLHIYSKNTPEHRWVWSNVAAPVPEITWVDDGTPVYNTIQDTPISITITLGDVLNYANMEVIVDLFDITDRSLFIEAVGYLPITYNQRSIVIVFDKDKIEAAMEGWDYHTGGNYRAIPRLKYTTVEGVKELTIPFKHPTNPGSYERKLALDKIAPRPTWQWRPFDLREW